MSIQTRSIPRKQLMIATGRFDRMVVPDNLAAAWAKVKGNNGSPLLANLNLHPLDRMLAAAGIGAVRYADDFVLLCASGPAAWRAKRVVEKLLAHRGLTLNKARTRVAGPGEDVVFLGELLAPRAAPGWPARIWAWLTGWRNRRKRGGRNNA